MAELLVPVYTSIDQVNERNEQTQKRIKVAEEFRARYGRNPTYIARAPGRVNLIGEHIDYALFGVFPAAIERDILIALAPRPLNDQPGVIVANADPKYAEQRFSPSRAIATAGARDQDAWLIDINTNELRWDSYVKAGYYGVLNNFFREGESDPTPVDMLISGTIPAGSGLSSSAAIVVASTLGFLAVNDKLNGMTKGRLVEIAVANEKRVGVNSGGMDQAASVISTPNSALYISFYPTLSAQLIELPTERTDPPAVFVIANSLVVSDKAVSAKTQYNLRVVETLVGARILANRLGVKIGRQEKVTFREVLGRWISGDERESGKEIEMEKGLESILEEVESLKPPPETVASGQLGVTMEEMINLSGLPQSEFHQLYLSWVEVEATHFHLYNRARHVFSEALRVLQFRNLCLKSQPCSQPSSAEETLQALGNLMNESHRSCSDLFDCSCPELDELTALARASGAYGSRLTGAGWGGCTVSLVSESKVEDFKNKLRAGYSRYRDLTGEKLNEVVFATKPSSGAFVLQLEVLGVAQK
ncbi:Galactokinase [Thelephora terrestris]|uniref:Galactokinase n=1 Tax=Thelephora terrestris TaxID=56493 RepID=A0A9P6L1R3_9AGAM|nr:Galactokinase [Thelephora terrestris]